LELTHEFTVPASIDVAWAAFNDLERIAPCFPGASLTSYDGENFEGLTKVKLGPISLQYTGTGRFVERDEGTHTAVIEAKGRDKRGNGTAAANVTATLTAAGDDATEVTVKTDLNITGKPAQFGRGVMQDVSDKLLGQFASCLETKLGESGADAASDSSEVLAEEQLPIAAEAAAAAKESTSAGASAQEVPSAPEGVSAESSTPPASTSLPRSSPAAEAAAAELDLGATVLPVLIKRYAPRVIVALVVLCVLRKILSRRSRRLRR
jgi:carbon monoxide dehydrogenase subunit G